MKLREILNALKELRKKLIQEAEIWVEKFVYKPTPLAEHFIIYLEMFGISPEQLSKTIEILKNEIQEYDDVRVRVMSSQLVIDFTEYEDEEEKKDA